MAIQGQRDVVVGRRSAAASVAFADLCPEDAKELGEMLALRLRTLGQRKKKLKL